MTAFSLHRIENRFAREGTPLDSGTMSLWMEDSGVTLGVTIVAAIRAVELLTAFCIATEETDTTAVAEQPERRVEREHQDDWARCCWRTGTTAS